MIGKFEDGAESDNTKVNSEQERTVREQEIKHEGKRLYRKHSRV